MELNIKGKVALIAGGSSGIGFAVAQQLAEEGCHLVLCGRTLETLESAKNSIVNQYPNTVVLAVKADIYNVAEAQNFVNQAMEHFGTIDILVNCTEGAMFTPNTEVLEDIAWQTACEKKLIGYIRLIRLVFDVMKRQSCGKIINVVGLTGKEPSLDLMASGVINAGLINFIKAFSMTAAQYNICISGVNPGFISTPRYQSLVSMLSKSSNQSASFIENTISKQIPLNRVGHPEEVAALIAFLASDLANYITGITINVDGGLSKGI